MLNFTDLLMGKFDHIRPPAEGVGRIHRIGPDFSPEEAADLALRGQRRRDAELAANRAAVLQAIEDGAINVAEIMADTDLSQTTVQKHVTWLVDQKAIVQTGGERHRSPYTFAINPQHQPGATA